MPLGAVAGAAAGGLLSAGAAALSNKGNKNAANAYNAPLEAGIGEAQSIADQPFQEYTGQLAPGINAQEAQAAGLAGQGAQLQLKDLQQASTPFSGAGVQQYLNPYQQNVINPTLQNLTTNYQTNLANLNRKANMTDAFGYGRTAAETAPLTQQYEQEYGNTEASGLAKGYSNAEQEFNDQQGAFTKAAEGAGQVGQGLLRTGEAINATQDAQDKANYGEFLRGQNWSRQQIQPLISMLGTAYKGGLQSPAYTNPLSAAIGGAVTGAGLGLNAGGGGGSSFNAGNVGDLGDTTGSIADLGATTSAEAQGPMFTQLGAGSFGAGGGAGAFGG